MCVSVMCVCTVEPPIVDTLKSGQPPNNGQNTRPQRVHCSEVPLYYVLTLCISCVSVCVCFHSRAYLTQCCVYVC